MRFSIIFLSALLIFVVFGLGFSLESKDSLGYLTMADGMIEQGEFFYYFGGVKNYVFREPVYPAFLAGVSVVFGKNLLAVKWLQFFLFMLAVYGFYRLFDRSFWITFLFATFPSFHYYNGMILSEAIYVLLLAALVIALIKKFGGYAAVAGGLLGLAVLTKVVTLVAAPLALLYFGLVKKYKELLLALVVFLAVVLPWVGRNYYKTGQFVITAGRQELAAAAIALNLEKNQLKELTSDLDYEFSFYKKNQDNGKIQERYNQGLIATFVELAVNEPMKLAVNTVFNIAKAAAPEVSIAKKNRFLNEWSFRLFFVGYFVYYFFIYGFCLAFLIKLLKKREKDWLTYLVFLMPAVLLAVNAFFFPLQRFNTPLFVFYFTLLLQLQNLKPQP